MMSTLSFAANHIDLFGIGNHLWQSTLVAAAAGLLTLALRNNRAQVRHWLWLVASVKFLVPFAVFVALGSQLGWRLSMPIAQPQLNFIVDTVSQPFSRPELRPVAVATPIAASMSTVEVISFVLLAIWLAGCTLVLTVSWARWRYVARTARAAWRIDKGPVVDTLRTLESRDRDKRPLVVVASDESFEPGVFGILKPVLLWPRKITGHLNDAQVKAILAHELSHVRRRDNLTAVAHMFVEALFWFHPLVWWVGARLIDERERACDEEVLRLGSEPKDYAESILKICQFYVESPIVWVAGVTGSDLKTRIERIMKNQTAAPLNSWRKALLATAALGSLSISIVIGTMNTPQLRAQSPQASAGGPAFDAASVKPNKSGSGVVAMQVQPGGRFVATNVTLRMLIAMAYGTPQPRPESQIVGGPSWINSDRFDVVAKVPGDLQPGPQAPAPEMFLMIRALLKERFKLAAHNENRDLPIYALVLARSDGKLGSRLNPATVDCAALRGRGPGPAGGPPPPSLPSPGDRPACSMRIGPGNLSGGSVSMALLATTLSRFANRVVVDRTGLAGNFDADLTWTPDQLPNLPAGGLPPGAPAPPPIDPNGPSLFTAVQEQLGLKLDPQRAPTDIVVVDSVEHPTED